MKNSKRITDKDISNLRDEAAKAGDDDMVLYCDRVLCDRPLLVSEFERMGSPTVATARYHVEKVIDQARDYYEGARNPHRVG